MSDLSMAITQAIVLENMASQHHMHAINQLIEGFLARSLLNSPAGQVDRWITLTRPEDGMRVAIRHLTLVRILQMEGRNADREARSRVYYLQGDTVQYVDVTETLEQVLKL